MPWIHDPDDGAFPDAQLGDFLLDLWKHRQHTEPSPHVFGGQHHLAPEGIHDGLQWLDLDVDQRAEHRPFGMHLAKPLELLRNVGVLCGMIRMVDIGPRLGYHRNVQALRAGAKVSILTLAHRTRRERIHAREIHARGKRIGADQRTCPEPTNAGSLPLNESRPKLALGVAFIIQVIGMAEPYLGACVNEVSRAGERALPIRPVNRAHNRSICVEERLHRVRIAQHISVDEKEIIDFRIQRPLNQPILEFCHPHKRVRGPRPRCRRVAVVAERRRNLFDRHVGFGQDSHRRILERIGISKIRNQRERYIDGLAKLLPRKRREPGFQHFRRLSHHGCHENRSATKRWNGFEYGIGVGDAARVCSLELVQHLLLRPTLRPAIAPRGHDRPERRHDHRDFVQYGENVGIRDNGVAGDVARDSGGDGCGTRAGCLPIRDAMQKL